MLASDLSACPDCQHEAGQQPSGLGSADSGREGSGPGGSGGGSEEADGDRAQSSEAGASSGLQKEEEEVWADGAARLRGGVWRETRARLRGVVDSKYFSRGIMVAILVNTVSMGIEHHEQASGGGVWVWGGAPEHGVGGCLGPSRSPSGRGVLHTPHVTGSCLGGLCPIHPCGLCTHPEGELRVSAKWASRCTGGWLG